MKKLIFSLLTMLLSASLYAASYQSGTHIKGDGKIISQKRSTETFCCIKASGNIEMIITKGDDISVVISGEENLLPLMETKVENQLLIIKPKEGYSLKFTRPIKIYVTAPNVEKLTVDSGSASHESRFIVY